MKINWGTGTLIFFSAFIIFMVVLVVMASRQDVQLVTDKYYEKELEFQEIRVKQALTAGLSEQLRWTVQGNQLLMDFPAECGESFSGILYFYNPSNERLDRTLKFETANDTFYMDISEIVSGHYTLKADWQAGGQAYYNEGILIKP